MKRILSGVLASVLAMAASAALAQGKPPLKLGGILDMSGLYADITGPGSETAAKMAAEDFGGEVLGRKIEIIAADHLNKADLAANIARDMLDNQGVEMIFDVALRTAPGRARAGTGLNFQRARARAGKEYFSRRCCRKVSAERSLRKGLCGKVSHRIHNADLVT